jgi:hypothetical protein
MVEQQEFQIPQQLRELAEKSVEQARVAYGQFLDGMAEAVRAWSTVPSAVMASGFKVVQERAIQFAKENAEAGFALASELAKAKDLQEVLRLQSNLPRYRCSPTRGRRRSSAGSWRRPRAAESQKAERGDRAAQAMRDKAPRRPDDPVRAWNGL